MHIWLHRDDIARTMAHVARTTITTIVERTSDEYLEDFGAQLAVARYVDGDVLWTIGKDPGGNVQSATGAILRVAHKRDPDHHYIVPWGPLWLPVRWDFGVSVLWCGREGESFHYEVRGQIAAAAWREHREIFYGACARPFWYVPNWMLTAFRGVTLEAALDAWDALDPET